MVRNSTMGNWQVSIIILLALISPTLGATPISQQLYEDQTKMKCDAANSSEVTKLKNVCPSTNDKANLGDLDKTAEYLVFKPIAEKESDKLGCMLSQVNLIKDNSEVRSAALKQACSRLDLLKDAIDNEEYLLGKIHSYEVANDASMRMVPEQESKDNDKIIKSLKEEYKRYREIEFSLKTTDPLLGSPRVFEALKSRFKEGMFSRPDTPEVACKYLESHLGELIAEDAKDIQKSQQLIQNNLKSGNDWLSDESFKKNLWASSSKEEFLQNFVGDADFKKSTYCRMEGRYGQGLERRDTLLNLGSMALGFGAAQIGKVAAVAVTAQRVEASVVAARVALGIDVMINTTITAHQLSNSCKDSVKIFSDQKSCNAMSSTDLKNIFYKKNEAGSCLLDSTLAVVGGGLSAVGIKASLSGVAKNNLPNELAAREALSSDKILKLSPTVKQPTTGYAPAQNQGAVLTPYGVPARTINVDGKLQGFVEGRTTERSLNALKLQFSAIQSKSGVLPNQLRKAEVIQSIEEALPRYEIPTMMGSVYRQHRELTKTDFEAILKHNFPDGFKGYKIEDLEVVKPKTVAGSGAQVYLLKNKKPPHQIVASVKIQPAKAGGQHEVATTIDAETNLAKISSDVKVVKTLAAGKLNNGDFILIQEGARGKDFEGLLHAQHFEQKKSRQLVNGPEIQRIDRATDESADLFARLHRSGARAVPAAEQIKAFRDGTKFEIAAMNTRILGKDGALDSMVARGAISQEQANILRTKIEANKKEYERILKDNPELLRPTIVHGDAHGGNIFIGPNGKASFIDYGTMSWCFGKDGVGVCDPGNDIGRMVASMRVEALKNGLGVVGSDHIVNNFIKSYKKEAGIRPNTPEAHAFDVSVKFYEARFFGIQASDIDHVKFNSDSLANKDLLHQLGTRWYKNYLKVKDEDISN